MKPGFILCILVLLPCQGFTQDNRNRCGDYFEKEQYPADSFSIQYLEYPLGKTVVVLTLVHHKYLGDNNVFFQLWIEQRRGSQVIKSQYWGYEEDENGYMLPNSPLLEDFFVINNAREFTGTFF